MEEHDKDKRHRFDYKYSSLEYGSFKILDVFHNCAKHTTTKITLTLPQQEVEINETPQSPPRRSSRWTKLCSLLRYRILAAHDWFMWNHFMESPEHENLKYTMKEVLDSLYSSWTWTQEKLPQGKGSKPWKMVSKRRCEDFSHVARHEACLIAEVHFEMYMSAYLIQMKYLLLSVNLTSYSLSSGIDRSAPECLWCFP